MEQAPNLVSRRNIPFNTRQPNCISNRRRLPLEASIYRSNIGMLPNFESRLNIQEISGEEADALLIRARLRRQPSSCSMNAHSPRRFFVRD